MTIIRLMKTWTNLWGISYKLKLFDKCVEHDDEDFCEVLITYIILIFQTL